MRRQPLSRQPKIVVRSTNQECFATCQPSYNVEHGPSLSIEFTVLSQPKTNRLHVIDILRQDRWHAKLDQQGYNDERMADIGTVMNALTSCRTGYMGKSYIMRVAGFVRNRMHQSCSRVRPGFYKPSYIRR